MSRAVSTALDGTPLANFDFPRRRRRVPGCHRPSTSHPALLFPVTPSLPCHTFLHPALSHLPCPSLSHLPASCPVQLGMSQQSTLCPQTCPGAGDNDLSSPRGWQGCGEQEKAGHKRSPEARWLRGDVAPVPGAQRLCWGRSVITCPPYREMLKCLDLNSSVELPSVGGHKGTRALRRGRHFHMESLGRAADGAALPREEAETGDREGKEGMETGITGVVTP